MSNFHKFNYHKIYILFLWALLTAINLNKAYHIDDTFHLEAAQYIDIHPFKPMSGYINWKHSPTPIYNHNQPPLFFYLIAIYQKFFGTSEIALHLLLSLFTYIALLYFHKITRFLKVKTPLIILTIFAFCPAFIVNQNLMIDVPILAISISTVFYLLKGHSHGKAKYYLISSGLLSIGLLTKYSLTPLFLVILITILGTKNYKKSLVLLIPLITLLLWSIWNYVEFGSVHLISRPGPGLSIKKIVAFISTLGAMSLFSVVCLYDLFPKKLTRFLIVLIYVLFFLVVPAVYFSLINEIKFNRFLNYIFIINGIILLISIIFRIMKSILKENVSYLKTPLFPIAIYIIIFSLFIALFSPFNATRHVLLIIPFILLFQHTLFEKSRGLVNKLVIVASIVLGVLLGISDWLYADFYRSNIKNINIANNKVWSLGHWGWQWYSKKAGMQFFSKVKELEVRKGHLVVFPKDISKQKLSPEIKLDTIRFITDSPTFFTFFSGKDFASMYNSYFNKPPWTLSNIPIDTIFICEVKKEINVNDIINRIRLNENWLSDVRHKATNRNIPLDSMLFLDASQFIEKKRSN